MAAYRSTFAVIVVTALAACGAPAPTTFQVKVHHVPEKVYTAIQGEARDPAAKPPGAHADGQNLTWLFHLVLTSEETSPIRIETAEAAFKREGRTLWREVWSRVYLERLEWIEGAFEATTEYFLENVKFSSNAMVSKEKAVPPDVPPGQSISWVRIPFARPWFARIDAIEFSFELRDGSGREGRAAYTVPINNFQQKTKLRLPFSGVWVVNWGNDLATGHRRTGLNALTTYGWDFVKLGPDGRPYRTDGKAPRDYYAYGAEVRAAGDGVVAHVRNDIPEYGVGEDPTREVLEKDGDVFAGNLVVIDHGGGEYTLTCHMQPGTVPLKAGDRVAAGQFIGRAGNSGHSQIPHIHFNLMNGPRWLEARGMPALFSDFERIRSGPSPERLALANPVTGWWIRPVEPAAPRRTK